MSISMRISISITIRTSTSMSAICILSIKYKRSLCLVGAAHHLCTWHSWGGPPQRDATFKNWVTRTLSIYRSSTSVFCSSDSWRRWEGSGSTCATDSEVKRHRLLMLVGLVARPGVGWVAAAAWLFQLFLRADLKVVRTKMTCQMGSHVYIRAAHIRFHEPLESQSVPVLRLASFTFRPGSSGRRFQTAASSACFASGVHQRSHANDACLLMCA